MTIDESVEAILPKVNNIPNHFWALHQDRFGKTDDDNNEIQFLYDYMTEKRLIQPGTKDEEYVVLTPFGYKVLTEYNGWINYLNTSKNQQSGQITKVEIGTLQQVVGSTIHGGINQSSDSSSNKSTIEPKQMSKKSISIKTIIKFIFWILGAIVTMYGIYEIVIKTGVLG